MERKETQLQQRYAVMKDREKFAAFAPTVSFPSGKNAKYSLLHVCMHAIGNDRKLLCFCGVLFTAVETFYNCWTSV